MNLPELCIRRPVMTTLLMLAITVGGILGYRLLSVAALPRVDFPTIVVSAQLPGASPETMASSVATPLERQFSTIAGISSMSSVNGLGTTQITIQFDLDRSIDGAALDVQSALAAAARRLPPELTTPPSFRKVNPADQPVLFLSLRSDTVPLSTVDEYAETTIAQRLSTLSGVAQVVVYGAQKYAVRVQVDPKALNAAGLGLDEVGAALAATNASTPVGQIDGPRQSVTLQSNAQLGNAAAYRSLIVAYRSGKPVRLADVAQVLDGVENDQVATWRDGTRSIVLAIQRQPDANTVAVVDSIRGLLPQLQAALPAAVHLDVMLDRSDSIRHSVEDVQFTLGLTVALVVMVIFLFLRDLRATLIPSLALPIALIGTFAGMYVLGYSIDNLSLLALTLSVGFVVDDAIVMLENIVRHVEAGDSPMQAAFKGSREIGFTIVSMTLSLVAVFIPILFMGGIVGRLYREYAVTISLAILISGFVSLTLTPLLASRMLRPVDHTRRPGAVSRWLERCFDATANAYVTSLDAVLRFRVVMLAVTVGCLALSAWLYVIVPKGFFPTEDTGMISATTEGPQGISFDAMSVAQKRMAEIIAGDPAVATVNSTVGAQGSSASVSNGQIFIGLKPLSEREPVTQVIQRLRVALGNQMDLRIYMQPVQSITIGGRRAKALYQYTLQGDDFTALSTLAPKLEARLRDLPMLQDVTSDLQIANPQAMVDVDRDKAAALGVTVADVRSALYSAFGDRQVATIYTPSNEYAVILELQPDKKRDVAALNDIYLRSSAGGLVPLQSVASIRRMVGPVTVNHQGQLPAVTLSFNLAPGHALSEAVEAIGAAEREIGLPASIGTSFQGTAQAFQDSLKGQGLLLAAAFFAIYVVLGILYESFIHPITILSGLPSAGIGALLTLMLFGTDLSVIAMIGIVMLIGIVKKNAIMMVDFAIERQREPGVTAEQAIREACRLRFRPIMMTTMAAIMGGLPIALGFGAGAELRQPLGLTVIGGLVFSQLLTLYITPVIYLYMEGLRRPAAAPADVPAAAPFPAE